MTVDLSGPRNRPTGCTKHEVTNKSACNAHAYSRRPFTSWPFSTRTLPMHISTIYTLHHISPHSGEISTKQNQLIVLIPSGPSDWRWPLVVLVDCGPQLPGTGSPRSSFWLERDAVQTITFHLTGCSCTVPAPFQRASCSGSASVLCFRGSFELERDCPPETAVYTEWSGRCAGLALYPLSAVCVHTRRHAQPWAHVLTA